MGQVFHVLEGTGIAAPELVQELAAGRHVVGAALQEALREQRNLVAHRRLFVAWVTHGSRAPTTPIPARPTAWDRKAWQSRRPHPVRESRQFPGAWPSRSRIS